jgi:deazaflavin-dependent oxidoreductase (nitroreductase family)
MARTYRLGRSRRLVNRALVMALGVGIGPKATYLLTTTGRRTGQRRTTPVTLVESESGRWLVAPYGPVPWVLNVRQTPRLELRRGRRAEVLHARELPADRSAPVLRTYVRQVPVTRPFFDVTVDSPLEDFERQAPRHPVFALLPAAPFEKP